MVDEFGPLWLWKRSTLCNVPTVQSLVVVHEVPGTPYLFFESPQRIISLAQQALLVKGRAIYHALEQISRLNHFLHQQLEISLLDIDDTTDYRMSLTNEQTLDGGFNCVVLEVVKDT